jgi:uncharacterized lipoprotein YajG
MLTINKQDILKTLLIIWFVGATGYVAYDIYASYKIRGMQAAYNQGYADSISQVIDQTEKNQCQPLDIHNADKKIQTVDARCLPAQTQTQPAAVKK